MCLICSVFMYVCVYDSDCWYHCVFVCLCVCSCDFVFCCVDVRLLVCVFFDVVKIRLFAGKCFSGCLYCVFVL